MDLSDLKLTDVAFPTMSAAWIFRELFGFARRDVPNAPAEVVDPSDDVPTPPDPPLTPGVRRDRYSRLDIYIPALIALCFYLLAIVNLPRPTEQIFDEVHHARSAMEYVDGLVPHEWSHPPFSKEMIALSIKGWHGEFNPRDGVWNPNEKFTERQATAWRFASVVFGTLTLPAIFFLARVLFGNRTIATASAVLLALDGVFFVQSRIAMTNIYTVFFITLGAGWLALYFREPKARWLLIAGAVFGLAIASRWSSLYAWAVAVLLLGLRWFYSMSSRRSQRNSDPERAEGEGDVPAASRDVGLFPGFSWIGLAALCFVFVPFVLYFASYIPNILQGPGTVAEKLLTLNGPNGLGWEKTFTLQRDMYVYHTTLVATHPYASPWWAWPVMLRPVWYYFKGVPGRPGYISAVWCIGNAFIWWASVPAFLVLCYRSWKNEIRPTRGAVGPLGLVAAFGLGQWLAWGVKERSLDFMHYYFECIPFACVALAYMGYRFWYSESGDDRDRRSRRTFVICYAAAVVFWFIFYYPLLTAYPVSEWYYGQHLWLGKQWI